MLTGDNNKEILLQMICENSVQQNRTFTDCISNADILLAPHHGRVSDFCEEFFNIVKPKLTIISDKKIEHETQENSADYYKGRGLQVGDEMRYTLTTRKDGSIRLKIFQDGRLSIETKLDPSVLAKR